MKPPPTEGVRDLGIDLWFVDDLLLLTPFCHRMQVNRKPVGAIAEHHAARGPATAGSPNAPALPCTDWRG